MRAFVTSAILLTAMVVVANGAVIVQTDWSIGGEHDWSNADQLSEFEYYGGELDGYDDPLGNIPGSIGSTWDFSGSAADGLSDLTGTMSDEYVATAHADYRGNYRTGAGLGGTQEAVQRIDFDFYSDPNGGGFSAPADLRVFFVYDADDSTGNRCTWYYDVADQVTTASDWNSVSAHMYDSNWYSQDNDGGVSWVTALSEVDRIGVYIAYHPSYDAQDYDIDNFTLDDEILIPEPGTFVFLGFAFVSLGVTFRRRLSDFVGKLKK